MPFPKPQLQRISGSRDLTSLFHPQTQTPKRKKGWKVMKWFRSIKVRFRRSTVRNRN